MPVESNPGLYVASAMNADTILPSVFETSPFLHNEIVTAFSIDSKQTKKVDDVIYVRDIDDSHVEIIVGFANPTIQLTFDDYRQSGIMDEPDVIRRFYRCSSLLHKRAPHKKFSLNADEIRPAIVSIHSLDLQNLMVGPSIIRLAQVRNKCRYTYGQADMLMKSRYTYDRDTHVMKQAARAALVMKALRFHKPSEISFDYDSDEIYINNQVFSGLYQLNSPANAAIGEFTLHSNKLIAKLAEMNHIPLIFQGAEANDSGYLKRVYSEHPIGRPEQGLASYSRTSGQLRGLVDKINGLQLNSYLQEPDNPSYFFSQEEISFLAKFLNNARE